MANYCPSHPDLQPILKDIRSKYNIPEIGPEDDGITEILLSDEYIDWDEVYQEIKNQICALPGFLPDELQHIFDLGDNPSQASLISGEQEANSRLVGHALVTGWSRNG